MNTSRFGLHALLPVTAMCFMAISHPIYDLLVREDHATFFVAHESTAIDIYVLVFVLSIALPLAVFGVLRLVSLLSRQLGRSLFGLTMFALFAGLFLLTSAKVLGHQGWANVAIAAGTAALCTLVFFAAPRAREFLNLLAIGALVSPVLFLTDPVIRDFLKSPQAQDSNIEIFGRDYPNVVLIIFDELPLVSLLDTNHQIDSVRFPNFARLANSATWYRNTATPHTTTPQAIPAILTGRYINQSQPVVGSSGYPQSLVSHLRSSHQLRGVEAVSTFFDLQENQDLVSPLQVRLTKLGNDLLVLYGHLVIPEPLTGWLPSIRSQWSEFRAPELRPEATEASLPLSVRNFIELVRTTPRSTPAFFYLHLLLPHSPLRYNDDGRNYGNELHGYGLGTRSATPHTFAKNRQDALLIHQAHLLQTMYVDSILGEILEELQSLGLFEDSLLVVTSDHGIGYLWYETDEADQKALFSLRAPEVYWVPLFLKLPGQQRGKVIDARVVTVDIFPTIAEALDKPIPWEVDGFSVLEPPEPLRDGTGNPVQHQTWLPAGQWDDRALQSKVEIFGQHNLEDLYFFGPFKELVGRNVDTLPVGDDLPYAQQFSIDGLEEIERGEGLTPLFLKGELIPAQPNEEMAAAPVAIAINGTIWGTAEPVLRGERNTFVTRIPPEAWSHGGNSVSVFAIRENQEEMGGLLVRLGRARDE